MAKKKPSTITTEKTYQPPIKSKDQLQFSAAKAKQKSKNLYGFKVWRNYDPSTKRYYWHDSKGTIRQWELK